MKKRRLKKGVVYTIYVLLGIGFCSSLYFIENKLAPEKQDINYVDKVILDKEQPVVNVSEVLIRPYISDSVEILSNYYDNNADENTQQNSIIYYNNTYIQNSGTIYGQDDQFDVVAIYDGEVIKVDESSILGKVIEIRHSNDVISIYQLLGDVKVELNSKVKQGQKIGTSSLSNILGNNKQQLYFELAIRGQLVNGEQYFGKRLEEI